ncbi:MAG: GDSL-type esterase/lipase family protein [Oscillospiraceae bacterium]
MRVLCFGDSNTYGYDPRSYLGGRYPAASRWVDLLARETGWEVVNAGENGREIPRRPIALPRQIDLLLVMLGTNDLLQGADAAGAAARMEAFLRRLPVGGDRLLLIAPPPLQPGAWVTEEGLIAASAELAARYRDLAERLGIRFADAAGWGIELAFDGVHFSEAGHRAFAAGLCALLKDI